MRTAGLCFQILISLAATSNSQTVVQGGDETSASFIDNAMKLREKVLFRVEPVSVQRSTNSTLPSKYFWHTSIVTTTFWIGETPSDNNPVPNAASAWD